MKTIFTLLSLFFLFSCNKSNEKNDIAHDALSSAHSQLPQYTLYVSADIHWQRKDSNNRIAYLDEIINTLLYTTIKDDVDALILCGDLTNSGRLEEHIALSTLLTEAQDKGVNIFVTMGNHDMDSKLPIETLETLYGEFGFNDAIFRDLASMSYLTKLNNDILLLSLDCNVYGEKTSTRAATISDTTLVWVEKCLMYAKEVGAFVLPFSHHNLVEHAMDNHVVHYNIDKNIELQRLLMKYDVPLYLSGHRHGSFVASAKTDDKEIHEIVVDIPSSYPFRYTSLEFNESKTITYTIPSLDISAWAKETGNNEKYLMTFTIDAKADYEKWVKENGLLVAKNLTNNTKEQKELARYYEEIFIASKNKTLWQEKDRLLNDSALTLWKKYEDESVFARWMPWMLENSTDDHSQRNFGPYELFFFNSHH